MRGVPSDSPGLPPTRTFSVSLDLKKEKQKVPEVTRPVSGGARAESGLPCAPASLSDHVWAPASVCLCAYACVLGEYMAVLSCRDSHCAGASPARCLSRCPFSGNPLVPGWWQVGRAGGGRGQKAHSIQFLDHGPQMTLKLFAGK